MINNIMKVVGITGGIATGKTFIANYFETLGYKVFNADKVVHQIFSEGDVVKHITGLFLGVEKGGVIDRKLLGDIVYGDKDKKKLLEDYIHPIVRQRRDEFLKDREKNGDEIVFLDIPLLIETNGNNICDYVIVCKLEDKIQKQRALERSEPRINEDKYNKIKSLQIKDEDRVKQADFVIDTGKEKNFIYRECDKIISLIKNK
tara:strand:+ start:2042 stop:2650 length:609 start_codon:yes stop_codon:yes gene_type:complete